MHHQFSKRVALLQWLTITAMVVLPVAIVAGLVTTPLTPANMNGMFNGLTVSPDITRNQLSAAVASNLISPVVLILTLNEMRRLFGSYRRGTVLTDDCARLILRIGRGFLALALIPFVLQPVQSVLLTLSNPPGQTSLFIGFSSEMVFFALSGGLIIVVGWAMHEASDIAAENRSFV